ncbi:CHAT domain-containing tetratricopeptide repeat protein [Aquimarina gracilis]|uniref:CHAT domain-containing tetratricopeptide repeat protein n=1 Tax=Aquimarina gracilis TaxID=874422 RepID=A0ABU5ZYP0_9FLAO|nr:CHAT domain-containing tetratricopeptide repeat protein [Aquimarina gracilis]MEB3346936.1 CHAT domain-containing tetratricopeptide repeat protein [Aquimarina gracilis]
MIKNNQIILILIFSFLASFSRGQEISSKLDSIHKLDGSDYEKLDVYHNLFDIYKNNKDYTQLGHDAHQLAKWIHKEKKWEEAIAIVKTAYQAREKAQPYDIELLKRSYYNYAIYNKRYNNYSIAIEFFEKMLALKGTNFLRGRAYAIIGECYSILGDYYKSVDYQIKSLQNYSKSDIKKGRLIDGNIIIAVTYGYIRSAESSKKAIEHLKEAETLLKKRAKNNPYKLYLINNNLGNLYCEGVKTKDLNKCIESYTKALDLLKELELKEKYSKLYYNLGLTFIKIDSSRSQYYFNKALKYSIHNPSFKPTIFFGLGLKELHQQNYVKVHENFSKTFSLLFDKEVDDIYWLPQKNDLEKVKDKVEFLELLKRKLKAWIELGKSQKKSSFFNEAIQTTYAADELINLLIKENLSSRTKLLWRSLASEIYVMGLEACVQLKKHDDAFFFMEKSKALLLLQEITKERTELPLQVLEKEKKLKNDILNLRLQIRDSDQKTGDSIQETLMLSESKLKKFTDSLSHLYAGYFTNNSIPKILSLPQLRVDSNEVILQYNMAERKAGVVPDAYVMLISNQKNELFKIGNVDKLQKNIFQLRKMLRKPFKTEEDKQAYNKIAYAIYNSLIPSSIQNDIFGKKLTIIPDHILNYVPFEALMTNLNKDNSYLINQSEIQYIYSLSFSEENSKIKRNAEKDFLGVAPIEFLEGLSSLPESKAELDNAQDYYSGNLLLKNEANKTNFKKEAKNYKILHLATHADASDSLNPWISFRKDKLIELEIGGIDHQAELVVLSACNTSLGEVRRGEGVLSLARGFFRSGANAVIPSLWNTNDKATATIISDFYKNLSEGKTKSEALRTAKLNYLHNNTEAEASPYYWAPLILIGDNGTLLPTSNNLMPLWISIIVLVFFLVIYYFFRHKKR